MKLVKWASVLGALALAFTIGSGMAASSSGIVAAAGAERHPDAAVSPVEHEHKRHPGGPMVVAGSEKTAKLLGMKTDELQKSLREGRTLAELAQAKGVDKRKVIDSIERQLMAKLDKKRKAGKMTKERYEAHRAMIPAAAAAIVDGKMPFRSGVRGGRILAGSDEMAKLLGVTEADLQAALRSGKTLADIAKEKGVDRQQVIDLLVGKMTARLDKKLQEGRITQAEYETYKSALPDKAAKIVSGDK